MLLTPFSLPIRKVSEFSFQPSETLEAPSDNRAGLDHAIKSYCRNNSAELAEWLHVNQTEPLSSKLLKN